MKPKINIEERKPIWIVLSDFYLDTELEESDFRHIAATIIDSPYTIEEVKEINKYEIFPSLQTNLLSVAGEWAGFEEAWLVDRITKSITNRSALNKIAIEASYKLLKWMQKDYWNSLTKTYDAFKADSNSYILNCRKLMKDGIEPFEFSKFETAIVQNLLSKAKEYKKLNKIENFCSYLETGQYWTNVCTAYCLLEFFDLKDSNKNIYMENELKTIKFCLGEILRISKYFKTDEAKENSHEWIKKMKTEYNIAL